LSVVCDLEADLNVLAGLDALVNKNLLQARDDIDADPRVVMLETVREYALERLTERGEVDAVARRHTDYFLALAEQSERELLGPRQGAWYGRLEADLDNFRAALAWSLAHQEADVTARVAGELMSFWASRGHVSEGLLWLDAALDHRDSLSRSALAKALFAKSYLLLQVGGDHEQAKALLEDSLSLFLELGDTTWTVRTVSVLGQAAMRGGEFDRGLALRERAVALLESSKMSGILRWLWSTSACRC
jgi:tetratricopeptide (TPR) repeat protein